MFCPNCGSPMNDEAVFCPICGKKVAAEQEVPAAPEAVDLPIETPETPDVFQTSETVVLTPDANPWAQPVEPAADPFAEPAADPFAEPDANPFAQVSFDEKPAKPKKKLAKILIPVIAVVLVAAIVALCFTNAVSGFFVKTFGSDEDYFEFVETNALEGVAASISGAYGSYIEMLNPDQALAGDLKLNVSEDALDMLSDATGADIDMDWINGMVFRVNGNSKEGLSNGNVALEIGGQTILDLAFFLDMDAASLILGLQNLTDEYIELDLNEMISGSSYDEPYYDDYNDPVASSSSPDLSSISALLSDEELVKALPTEKELNNLLNKYFAIIVESIDEVETSSETLDAGDLSQKVTAIEVKIDREAAAKITEAVLNALADDEEIETIIKNVAKVLEDKDLIDDADEVYDEFKDGIDEALDELEDDDFEDNIEEGYYVSDNTLVITSYVDGSHNLIGCEIESTTDVYYDGEKRDSYEQTISFATVTKGSNFATEIDLGEVVIEGEGNQKFGKVNAEYTLEVDGEEMCVLTVSDLKMGVDSISGKLVLKPSDEIWEAMRVDDMIKALDLGLSLDLSISKNKSSVTIDVLSDDEIFAGIEVNSETQKPQKVTMPDADYDMDEAQDWLESMDFDKLIDALEKAGLPDDLVESLEDMLQYIA